MHALFVLLCLTPDEFNRFGETANTATRWAISEKFWF